ncbi:MAG: tetratricopeptide repeat protein [Promethearchaeota archaeon]
MENKIDLNSLTETTFKRLEKFGYSDIKALKSYYENSHALKKEEIISKLNDKLDNISNLNIKNENVREPLLKDLIECCKCGLLPIEKKHRCFKCIMENIDVNTITELKDLATYQFNKKEYEFSIYLFKNLLKLNKDYKIENKFEYYNYIGNAYNKLNKKEKALKYYLLSYENLPKQYVYLDSLDFTEFKSDLYKKIGKLYYDLNFFKKSLSIFNKIDSNNTELLKLKLKTMLKLKYYINAHLFIKKIPSFLFNDEEFKEIEKEINNKLTSSEIQTLYKFDKLLVKAKIALESENFVDSLKYYQKALIIAKDFRLKEQIQNLSEKVKIAQIGLRKKNKILEKTELTGNEIIGDIVGKITKVDISKSAKKALSQKSEILKKTELNNIIEEDLLKHKAKTLKIKGIMKKGMKRFSKSAGKMAGDMIGDKISEVTGSEIIGDVAGKIAKVGVSKLAEKGLEHISKINDQSSRSTLANKEAIQTTHMPIEVNLKERLRGIIRAKEQVKIEYINKFLKISKEEIIGIIFDLIGSNQIKGKFNDDDSEFTLYE